MENKESPCKEEVKKSGNIGSLMETLNMMTNEQHSFNERIDFKMMNESPIDSNSHTVHTSSYRSSSASS